MAAVRTTLTTSWVKLADAGEFLIHNNSAHFIEIAIKDTSPDSLAETFTVAPFSSLPMLDYEQDIYGRGPGSVTLLAAAAA
jgi:hypothetical protein